MESTSSEADIKKRIASRVFLILLGFLIVSTLLALVLRTYLGERARPMVQVPATLSLPTNWPATVPVVEDATSSTVVEDFGLTQQSVTYTTIQTPEAIIAYYTASVTSSGGTIEATLHTDKKDILSAKTADGKRYVVYAGITAGTTLVTVNVEPQPAPDVAQELLFSQEN